MTRRKIGRNDRCPCGSGKKYKKCCQRSGAEFDDDGNEFQRIPINDELNEILLEQKQRFRDAHGRDPGPNDPVFFDAPPFEVVEHQMVQAMREAGVDPAKVNAFIETGLLPTEENSKYISPRDLQEWQDAIQKHEQQHGRSLPKVPWTKSEWSSLNVESLRENDGFWEYFGEIESEILSNRELMGRYLKMVELLLIVAPGTDLEDKDAERFERQRETLPIERETTRAVCKQIRSDRITQVLGRR